MGDREVQQWSFKISGCLICKAVSPAAFVGTVAAVAVANVFLLLVQAAQVRPFWMLCSYFCEVKWQPHDIARMHLSMTPSLAAFVGKALLYVIMLTSSSTSWDSKREHKKNNFSDSAQS